MFVGISGLFAADLNDTDNREGSNAAPPPVFTEISGTYKKDHTVTTELNTVSKKKTLRVKKGVTFIITDAVVDGSIVVDKGGSLIAAKDGAGYLAFKKGATAKGIDLYYKVRVSDDEVFTRKIPMTLDAVWKSKNQELIDIVGNMEFCYSSELKGWVTINEVRFLNPFNEEFIEQKRVKAPQPLVPQEPESAPPAPGSSELSGTYSKDYTVKTEFNTVAKGKTLHVTNGATFIMTDAIVSGNIIVDKGSSLIAAKDGAGYMVIKQGTHVEGIDLYYKVRVSDNLVFTRKIPMTLDEVWKSGKKELIDWVGNIEFCYSTALKGWVSINEIRFMNPFNENLYEDYDMVFTKSASRELDPECRSLIVKNKSKLVVQPIKDKGRRSIKINESIIIEKGSSMLGTGPDGAKLELKKGVKVQGLPLYIIYDNKPVLTESILPDLWELQCFNDRGSLMIYYDPALKGWVFEDRIYSNDISSELRQKIER